MIGPGPRGTLCCHKEPKNSLGDYPGRYVSRLVAINQNPKLYDALNPKPLDPKTLNH